jgi:hypothetical protein
MTKSAIALAEMPRSAMSSRFGLPGSTTAMMTCCALAWCASQSTLCRAEVCRSPLPSRSSANVSLASIAGASKPASGTKDPAELCKGQIPL